MTNIDYPYISGDGVPIARPLFQEEGDGLIPISPLHLHFETCALSDAVALVRMWHSRLPVIAESNAKMYPWVAYWATFSNRVYACSIWSQPVARLFNGRNYIELRRMAISPTAPRNTASRMLGWMVRDIRKRFPDVVKCISYQDAEVHTGTIYKASGWVCTDMNRDGGWNRPNRFRKAPQSGSAKYRWELTLK